MKIYISGKITGDRNYQQKFDEAEKLLKEAGHIVLNPAKQHEGLSRADYMRICFAMMECADAVYFLNDFTDSQGAMLELEWCRNVDKPIVFEMETLITTPKHKRLMYQSCFMEAQNETKK